MLSRVPSMSDGLWVWVPHLPTFHFTLSSAGHSKFSSCQEALGLSVFSPFSLREREREREREIPQVKRDKLLLALLPLSGSRGSAGNIYTPNDHFSQLEDISSRFLWARPVWWQKPLHFQGYSQEVWQEPPRKWWLAHEQTPQTGPRETKRPTAWRHHSALNSQSWAICGHLVWAPEVAECKSYKPDFPWLEE